MTMLIKGGRVIDPASGRDTVTDVCIDGDRIASIGAAPKGFKADEIIDAGGLVVCPGLVDLCARLREPGSEHKGNMDSETRAAAAGGITTLCVPPDSSPVVDTPAMVELIRRLAKAAGMTRVLSLGAMTKGLNGNEITEMYALKKAGCVGISNALRAVASPLVLRRALEYAASYNLKVHLYPEDPSLAGRGCVHEGEISMRMGLTGIPECAETIAVARDLLLIEQTGVEAHFCRVSSARALRMICRARHDGLPVTVDVAAHQLHLTEMDILDFNAQAHVRPPLRSQRDRQALVEALASGEIDAVCSDHQPHDKAAKLLPFAETEPGISAVETLLPLGLRAGKEAGMDLMATLAMLTSGPARVMDLDCGRLEAGAQADLCIFDPEAFWAPSPQTLHSEGKNTPFMHWELQGQVRHTVREGQQVWPPRSPTATMG